MAASDVTVTALNIFPIKSCHVLQVQEARIGKYGVHGDRRFMLIDGNNRFLSQRKIPKLATVHCKMEIDQQGREVMHVSAPGMEQNLTFSPILEGDRVEASIWDDQVMVLDQGEEPAKWFSEFIGHGGNFTRLVASAESNSEEKGHHSRFHRPVTNLPTTLKQRLPEMQLALADAGPVSLVSQESLADVNVRLKERGCDSVPLNRFRMNIEISGCCKPFEEDEWLVVKIGEVAFLAYTNAERCKMTGVNQDTGEQDKLGPLEILRAYRAPRGPTHAMFGQLMLPLKPGLIRVGDKVEVMDRKKTQSM